MEKISVYFMPGLAANASIFERISLPADQFDTYFMEWEIPFEKESLKEYAHRISKKITHKNPVLVGVSFGGILVQEMTAFLTHSLMVHSPVSDGSATRSIPLSISAITCSIA